MRIHNTNDPTEVFDRHHTLKCPHCQTQSGITAISIPRFEFVKRFSLNEVGVAYKCDACQEPVFLKHAVGSQSSVAINISDSFTEIERPSESFDYQYLPEELEDDFREALTCYSAGCHNAFAAMCRRCIQTAGSLLGAEGTAKVQNQLTDLRAMGAVDDLALEQLKAIMLSGHDGAHPHLPKVDSERALVLLEIMKDVMYQLFVRPAKIREATDLRKQAIAER
jgi:hypothetical protein